MDDGIFSTTFLGIVIFYAIILLVKIIIIVIFQKK